MSLPPSYFDRMYERDPDPWGFKDRPYEARKRAVTMASLTKARYRSVFEPGCSIGVLTGALAERAERVLAMDPAGAAIDRAQAEVGRPGVELVVGSVPADWPEEPFDLVVLSEVGYYLDGPALDELATRAAASATELVAVHWRHPVVDYPQSGDAVHDVLSAAAAGVGMVEVASHLEEDFRLQVWCRDGRSVARRAGLA